MILEPILTENSSKNRDRRDVLVSFSKDFEYFNLIFVCGEISSSVDYDRHLIFEQTPSELEVM